MSAGKELKISSDKLTPKNVKDCPGFDQLMEGSLKVGKVSEKT